MWVCALLFCRIHGFNQHQPQQPHQKHQHKQQQQKWHQQNQCNWFGRRHGCNNSDSRGPRDLYLIFEIHIVLSDFCTMQKMYHKGQKSKEIVKKLLICTITIAYFREAAKKIKTYAIKGGRGSRLLSKDPTKKKSYLWNLIFWILMGCGKARFSFGGGLPRALIAGCLELLCAGRLKIPGNKLWDQNFQF